MPLDLPDEESSLDESSAGSEASPALQHSITPFPFPTPSIPDHELLRRIGAGSYGEVWLARNVLGDYRAVKVIYRANFEHNRPYEREFEGIRKFEPISRLHDSQVDILHVGRNDAAGYFYYVMELADDASKPVAAEVTRLTSKSEIEQSLLTSAATYQPRTLKLDLYRRSRLPVDECIQIGLALTTALQHLHEHGLVHRDIKPSNIIFVDGVPKLADIGLVASMDKTMSFVGTSGFLPPEGPGTPQADIYSLGKVLYEISTGRDRQEFPKLPPELIQGNTRGPRVESGGSPDPLAANGPARKTEQKNEGFGGPPKPAREPRGLPLLELNAVILKACHRDPRQRYQSAKEMAADLEMLQRGKSVRRKRIIGRRLMLGAKVLLALTVLGLVVVGGHFLRGGRNSSESQNKRLENADVAMLCKSGRFHYYTLTEEGFGKAMEFFNRALEIDPNSVEAYAGIADLCNVAQPSRFLPPKAAEEKMRWVRQKLMAIDSRLAVGHAVQGYVNLVYDWKPEQADKEMKQALALDPELVMARIFQGRYFLFTKRFDEAEEEFKTARRLDPTRYGLNVHVGLPSFFARRYDRAIELFKEAVELMPNSGWALEMIGRAHEEKGDYQSAIEAFQMAELAWGGKPEVITPKYDALRDAYLKSGQDGYWRKRLDFVHQAYEAWGVSYQALGVAAVYAHLDDKENAFKWLDKAFEEKSEYLFWLNVDPCWDNIRSDSQFVALLKRMGFDGATARMQPSSPAELAGTKSLEAYKKYEQGRTARLHGNAEGLKEALKLMREAVELDPSFLRAWEELFSSYMESDAADAKSQQRAIVKKLEQVNPNSAEAHAAQAWIAYEDFELARADNEFQCAIRLDPS